MGSVTLAMASTHNSFIMARRLLPCSPDHDHNTTGSDDLLFDSSVNPSTMKILLLLFIAFFLVTFFSFYLRRCLISLSYPSPLIPPRIPYHPSCNNPPKLGLDHKLVESLPNVKFCSSSSPLIPSPNQNHRECVICLTEFRNEETLLFLPCCAPLFHPQCIKTWLNYHTTCPLCRHSFTAPLPHHPSGSMTESVIPSVLQSLNLQGQLCRMESTWHSMDIPQPLMSRGRDSHPLSPLFSSNTIWGTTDNPSSSHGDEKTPPRMKDIMGNGISVRFLKRSNSDMLVMRRDGDGDGENLSSATKRKRLTKIASDDYGSRWARRFQQEEQLS